MIILGDCRTIMAGMDAASVDAIVTDPPYGLEFMGKSWDSLSDDPVSKSWNTKGRSMTGAPIPDPDSPGGRHGAQVHKRPNPRCSKCGRAINGRDTAKGFKVCHCAEPAIYIPNTYAKKMQDWHETWAREAFRVLKPGGHLLAFGGTRTFHRLTVAIEDAGFEIRDSMLYRGYGSGFPKSHNVSQKAKQDGKACSCGGSAVQYVHETVSRKSMHDLRSDMAAEESLPVGTEQDLLAQMQRKADQSAETGQAVTTGSADNDALRGVRNASQAVAESSEENQDASVLVSMQRGTARSGVGDARTQGSGGMDRTEHGVVSPEYGRIEESSVEGRGDLLPQARELQADQVRQVSSRSSADGEAGRIRDGAPTDRGPDGGVLPDQNGNGASRRSRSAKQRPAEPRTVANEPGSQTLGRWPLCPRCGLPCIPDGFGSALKPAFEPIVVARKPLIGTLVDTFLAYGTGALNVDACRIETNDSLGGGDQSAKTKVKAEGWNRPWMQDEGAKEAHADRVNANVAKAEALGRWPANVALDEDAAAMLDAAVGERKSGGPANKPSGHYNRNGGASWLSDRTADGPIVAYLDTGGPSRFFYTAKASRSERNAGLEGMPEARGPVMSDRCVNCGKGRMDGRRDGPCCDAPQYESTPARGLVTNYHPTVKPISLMRWLVRLVTPPGGVVLDPFMGSGSTGCAAALEGFDFIGIEQDPDYVAIAERRIAYWQKNGNRPVKAKKIASTPNGVYANGKGRRPIARCPEHGESRDGANGDRNYKCGCRRQYDDYTVPLSQPVVTYQPMLDLVTAAD